MDLVLYAFWFAIWFVIIFFYNFASLRQNAKNVMSHGALQSKNNEKATLMTINREELHKVEIILDKELKKSKGEIDVGDTIYLEGLLSQVRDKCDQGLQTLKAKHGDNQALVDKLEKEYQKILKGKKEQFEERLKREKEKHREEKLKWEEERSVLKAKYEEMRWT